MTRGLSVVVTSMLPALPTDSWLASQAHRRQLRRERKRRRTFPHRCSLHSTCRPRRGVVQCRRAELSIVGLRARRFEFQKRSQLVIGVSNETPSIVAVRISYPDYRISVAAGADRGLLKTQRKPHFVCLFRFRFFAYSIHSRSDRLVGKSPIKAKLSRCRAWMRRRMRSWCWRESRALVKESAGEFVQPLQAAANSAVNMDRVEARHNRRRGIEVEGDPNEV